jgi:hypothetical protein
MFKISQVGRIKGKIFAYWNLRSPTAIPGLCNTMRLFSLAISARDQVNLRSETIQPQPGI